MKSVHVTDSLSAYIDGMMPHAEQEAVKAHLVFCSSCKTDLEDLIQNSDLLKLSKSIEPPPGLEERIILAMRSEIQKPEPLPFTWSWRPFALVATAAVAGIVVWQMPKDALFESQSSGVTAPKAERMAEPSVALDNEVPGAELSSLTVEKDSGQTQGAQGPKLDPARSAVADVVEAPIPNQTEAVVPDSIVRKGSEEGGRPTSRNPYLETGMTDRLLSRASMAPAVPVPQGQPFSANALSRPVSAPREEGALELHGTSSGITEPLTAVISSPAEWESVWNRHAEAYTPSPPRPTVDFNRFDVIAIFAGDQPTGGTSVVLDRVEPTSWQGQSAQLVRYQIQRPPEKTMKIMVITQPFVFKTIPKFAGQTFFEENP